MCSGVIEESAGNTRVYVRELLNSLSSESFETDVAAFFSVSSR